MKRFRFIACILAVLLLAGCAASRAHYQHEQARLAAIHAAAGEPVGSFSYLATSIYSWEPLNEHELLIYTRPRKAWLLNVGVCPQLPYAISIGVTSHVGQVSTGLDKVLVGGNNFPCFIQKIQPVDVNELHKKMQARDGAKMMPEKKSSANTDSP